MKIVYVDMDDVLCAYSKAKSAALIKEPEIAYPQSQFGFFQHLEPMPLAIASFQALMQDDRYNVYILTAPSIYNPFSYLEKRLWVENHLGFDIVHRLIISPNKGLNKGHFLIDDHQSGRGQEHFEGELLHFGGQRYPDWISVLQYLEVSL